MHDDQARRAMLTRESERLFGEAFKAVTAGQHKRALRLASQARILARKAGRG